MTMRLIDELLKDDFFNGGYQPPPRKKSRSVSIKQSEDSGSKRMLLYAVMLLLLLGVAGGAAWYVVNSGSAHQPIPEIPAEMAKPEAPAVDPLPVDPLPDVAEAAGPAEPHTETADPKPVEPAAATAGEPSQASPPTNIAKYALAFAPLSDRNEVEHLASGLRERGLTPSISETEVEVTRYAVLSREPVDQDEANAIRLKASVRDLHVEFRPADDGLFTYHLGHFDDADGAREIGAIAREIDIPIRLGRYQTTATRYHVEAGSFTERQSAEQQRQTLANEGIEALVKQVDP